MSIPSRICVAAAMVVLTLVTVRAAIAPQDQEDRKQATVRASLEKLGRHDIPGGLMDAVARAESLDSVRVDQYGAETEVLLSTSGMPEYRTFTLDSGRVVVVDLLDTVDVLPEQNVKPAAGVVQELSSSQFSLEPRLVSRVSIKLEAPLTYEVDRNEGLLIVHLAAPESQTQETPETRIAKICHSLEQIEKDQAEETQLALQNILTIAPEPVLVPVAPFVPERRKHSSDVLASLLALVEPVPLLQSDAIPLQIAEVDKAAPAASQAQPAPADDTAAAAPPPDTPPPPEKRPEDAAATVPVKMKQIMTDKAPEAPVGGISPTADEERKPELKAEPPALTPEPPLNTAAALAQIVNIDFREMELSNVVALLAQKAGINVIAGEDLKGVVTANLKNVTLQRAIETVLRMNGLGIVDEEGIYHIIPYQDALAAKRVTETVKLENGKVTDVKRTLDEVLKGSPDDTLMAISTNEKTNMLIIAGPEERVAEFCRLASALDVAEPVMPTVTEALKLNNAEPKDVLPVVMSVLSPDLGKAAVDERSRHLIVTDVPVVLEQVRQLLTQVDVPVKQVFIDAMIIDAVLNDASETGVDWIIDSVRHLNRRGQVIGSIQQLGLETDATANPVTPNIVGPVPLTGRLMLGILTDDLDIRGVIAAEVRNQRAKLLANPVITTVENKKASINISQEIPYQEFTQSLTGPPMATTSFKDIGIVLEVTPRVSHDSFVIAELIAKQSDTKGVVNSIPVEDKRETETTLRMKDGQTIFIGGLRRFDDSRSVRKIPVLGDIPVMNAVFRHNIIEKESTELLIFMTCNVLKDEPEPLSPELQAQYDSIEGIPAVPDSQCDLKQEILKPNKPVADPFWKWRRSR